MDDVFVMFMMKSSETSFRINSSRKQCRSLRLLASLPVSIIISDCIRVIIDMNKKQNLLISKSGPGDTALHDLVIGSNTPSIHSRTYRVLSS